MSDVLPRNTRVLFIVANVALLPLLSPVCVWSAAPIDAGKALAAQGNTKGATACASCHGANGEGNAAAGFPRLAALDAGYLAKELGDFRSKTRENAIMAPVAAALDESEVRAVTRHYAGMRLSAVPPGKPTADAARGISLAAFGDWSGRTLPACSQCHGDDGRGVSREFPSVANQNAPYLLAQLKAWKAGTRHNDPLGLMKAVATKLSEDEMRAVAAYYSTMTAPTSSETIAHVDNLPPPAAAQAGGKQTGFHPPPRSAIPKGPFGEAVRNGEAIFRYTDTHPASKSFVGNALQCENCHLDAGRLANASPMWAAYVSYPAYRAKNKKVNTIIERLQGCFSYSMNGPASKARKPPGADNQVMVDLVTYMYWLASSAPTGENNMPGRGYPKLKETQAGFDPKRGESLYADKCAVCHGANGEGRYAAGPAVFPPLWGARSYNWGAGMHEIDTLAAFLKTNMPLGLGGSLSDQESWDAAAFVNSHERPQDPRFKVSLAETRKAYHDSKFDFYGTFRTPSGKLLGAGH